MSDNHNNETAAERFSRTLKERAAEICSVRNDVYTTRLWQFAVNFVLGGGAIATLVVSMLKKGAVGTVCTIVGVALVVAVVVFNYVLRTVTPTSFLQYTHLEGDKRYTFQILSKRRFGFSDGEHNVEVDRGEALLLERMTCARYAFDFFADMEPSMRIVKGMTEEYRGRLEHNGKRYKCRIVFKSGVPIYGSVGGGRIKYFDINDTKQKFLVPMELKRAVKAFDIDFPKLPGVHVRDDLARDMSKQ